MLSRKLSVFCVVTACLVVLGLGLTPPAASATPDPTEQLRPFLKKVTDTLATAADVQYEVSAGFTFPAT